MQKIKTVFYNGNILKMNVDEILTFTKHNNIRVITLKTNWYSHDWEEVEQPNLDNLKNSNIYLTDKPIGIIMGTSVVSFT